jgi:2-C-methyl-D-erythritol 2,4-cyclodiphosphate synthase
MRIGMGYDVHRLVPERRLVIGGVTIPYEKGLLGHSDADVLLHAICDALLGAAGLGDIGGHFPDTDPAYRDIDSMKLLQSTYAMVREEGWRLVNIDATIFAQAPKMAPYRRRMAANIARALGADQTRINIKATTTEGLGLIGRGEGIAAAGAVLLAPAVEP